MPVLSRAGVSPEQAEVVGFLGDTVNAVPGAVPALQPAADSELYGSGHFGAFACEAAAREAGFSRLEMGATLTGVPFYRAKGYEALEELAVPLPGGESLPIVRMGKRLAFSY